jgi:drug/metabolite transporter (DMT)-like permease
VSAGAFVLVGFPGLLYTIVSGDLMHIIQNNHSHGPLLAAVGLSLICTVLANIVFYDLVQKTNAVFASSVTFLIPLVAILWGILDGENLTAFHGIAMGLIIFAIWLLRKK